MPNDDITQLKIGSLQVGIIGLKEAITELASALSDASDEEIAEKLIQQISQKNYIPQKARDDYGRSLVREFHKHLGRDPGPEQEKQGLVIRLLGQGCAGCQAFNRSIVEVLAEHHLAADYEHVTDQKEIDRYGVFQVPALLINEKLVAVGGLPNKTQLSEWFIKNNIRTGQK
jgi:glutaredoxin